MASKNIKGITIEIGGNTTKLESALKDVNKIVYSTNSELKQLNQALKLDPKNTELLAQKQDVLKKNIEATTQRLETLKEAQRQMGNYANLTEEQKEQYRALSVEIAKSEAALSQLNDEGRKQPKDDTKDWKERLKELGEVAKDVAKRIMEVTAALGGALAGLIGAGVKSFGEYEQQLGGIEAMFDRTTEAGEQAFKQIQATGSNAWKNLTMSTTDYYKTFTSTYTLVKNSIPDQQKAIETTNRMIQLESDLSNTFGYDIGQASNAINWALKGSFNYIDNLNLGIKGTKEGFLEAAQSCGYMVDSVDELTSDQILDILEQYADKFGVLGRTGKEAAQTIQGSVKSMQAAFDNFLNGSGSPDALVEAVTNFITNVSNAVMQLAPSILTGIVTLIQSLIPQIAQLLLDMIPQLLTAITNMINALLELIKENLGSISNAISQIINAVVGFITENLPTIIEMGIQLLVALVEGIIQSIPQLIPTLVQCIETIINTIIENLPLIIETGIDLLVALIEGIVDAIPQLVAMLPKVIQKLVETLTRPDMIVKIVGAALQLMLALGKGLIEAIPQMLTAIPNIIGAMVTGFRNSIANTNWGELGKNIIKGICDGFGRIGSYLNNKVNEVKEQITAKFKKIFGIHSPSTLMRDTIGLNITAGIGEGIEEGIPQALKDVDAAMKQLNAGIEASVNPTINPSVSYDTNYRLMASAMKEALQDMDIVMDDEKYGKFVVKTVTDTIYT